MSIETHAPPDHLGLNPPIAGTATPSTSAEPAAPEPTSEAAAPRPSATEIDALILPTTRDRMRTGVMFVLVSMALFTVITVSTEDPQVGPKAAVNLVRLVGLLTCAWALRGEGSARQTFAWTSVGVAFLLLPAIALTVLRNDVIPMAFFTVSMGSFAAILIPWGAWAQAAFAVACLASLLAAWTLLDHTTAPVVAGDTAITIANGLLVTIVIAGVFHRWQRMLRKRLEDARLADQELQSLHAELESRVVARTAELEVANRELEGFSYTVSHDLRSPLRVIAGFSTLIREEGGLGLDEITRERLAKIEAATLRMDTLIDDMLVLARVSRSAVNTEAVDLADLAREIGAELRSETPGREVQLRIAPIAPVIGDRGLLRIALDNILRNAWKFTASRELARIEVFGGRVGPTVSCHVRDNGIGFDMQFRAKLFRPFERIHDEKDVEGTGIGLATVARIVDRLGGDVDADGQLGEGATFTFRLPAAGR